MNHLVNSSKGRRPTRRYESPLREEQVEHTRERILDGLVTVLAEGPHELSVPAVAGAAGVSVPTVYRHFGSKKGLIDGLFERYTEMVGTAWNGDAPTDLDALLERVPGVFSRHGRVDPGVRAAMSGAVGREGRREHMPERLEGMETVIENTLGQVDEYDARMLRDVSVVLTSSAVYQTFRDFFGFSDDEAAEHTMWALEKLFDAVGPRRRPGGKR